MSLRTRPIKARSKAPGFRLLTARLRRKVRFVAIKVLPAEKVADAERTPRFVQEAKAASALNHPNIITIHDIAQEQGIEFMVM